MKSTLLPFLAFLAFAIAPLSAADDPRLAKIKAADDERVAAVLAGDKARLTAIFSDELRYTHSSGTIDTKATYTEALSTGRTKYTNWKYETRDFTFPVPGLALMTGRTQISVTSAKGPSDMVLSFLAVYREEQGRWRFLAWQSCKLPPAEPKP